MEFSKKSPWKPVEEEPTRPNSTSRPGTARPEAVRLPGSGSTCLGTRGSGKDLAYESLLNIWLSDYL